LDTSVDLYHEKTERLPIVAKEMLNMAQAADRLIVIDLDTGERKFLPSRSEITKMYAGSTNRHKTWYRGIRGTQQVWADKVTSGDNLSNTHPDVDSTSKALHGIANYVNMDSTSTFSEGWTKGSSAKFALAYAGNGMFVPRKSGEKGVRVGFYQTVQAHTGHHSTATHALNFDTAEDLFIADRSDAGAVSDGRTKDITYGTRSSDLSVAMYAYRCLTPSAYEYLVTNADIIADLPKVLKELGYAFERIYKSDRTTFDARIQDSETMRLGLGLTELAHMLRTRRLSRNAFQDSAPQVGGADRYELMKFTHKGITYDVSDGVVNEFFHYLSGSNGSIGNTVQPGSNANLIICPWWLADALDSFTFWDKDDELEMRDIERKDVMDAFNRLLEASSKEQGMNFGSHSRIPMMVFEDYKSGTLPDYKDYTSVSAALSANLLGYKNARAAYARVSSNNIGRLPYYPSIVSSKGTILGKEKAEFDDRIAEASDQTIRVGSSTEFQLGQQLVSPFSYKTVVMRTRFGESSMDTDIIPMMFQRIVDHAIFMVPPSLTVGGAAASTELTLANVVTFGLDHWLALDKNVSSMGYLPLGMNGYAYLSDYDSIEICEGISSDTAAHNHLWHSNYWRPGRDNYLYLMMDSLESVYREWDDAADRIRTEGVDSPTFASIGLMSEFTYATPSALWASNFGKLRRMLTVVSDSTATAANIDGNSTFFDAMALGNNYHGSSIWTGKTLFSLENRFLFDSALHERDGELNLAPGVLFLGSTASDSQEANMTALYQLRSACLAHTPLLSEPILDAYTAMEPDLGAIMDDTKGLLRHSGYGSNRIVFYEGEKDEFGSVRDVLVTPFAGGASSTYNFNSPGADGMISVYPVDLSALAATISDYVTIEKNGGNDYEMFLFSPARIRAGTSVQSRTAVESIGDLTEDDFIPGRHYDKIWLAGPLVGGEQMPQSTMDGFSQAVSWTVDADSPVGTIGVHYLKTATSLDANFDTPNVNGAWRIKHHVDAAARDEVASRKYYQSSFPWYQAATLSEDGLVAWKVKNAEFIEKVRSAKEYQAFNPVYTVFDLDFNDAHEALLNASLCMLGLGTSGPITYVGSMNADGSAGPSTTLTGKPAFDVVSLTLGAGAEVAEDVDLDDSDSYEENPDLEPKVVTEEVVN